MMQPVQECLEAEAVGKIINKTGKYYKGRKVTTLTLWPYMATQTRASQNCSVECARCILSKHQCLLHPTSIPFLQAFSFLIWGSHHSEALGGF